MSTINGTGFVSLHGCNDQVEAVEYYVSGAVLFERGIYNVIGLSADDGACLEEDVRAVEEVEEDHYEGGEKEEEAEGAQQETGTP